MDYATINSTYYCGIDLHARSMYVCVNDDELFGLGNEFENIASPVFPGVDRQLSRRPCQRACTSRAWER